MSLEKRIAALEARRPGNDVEHLGENVIRHLSDEVLDALAERRPLTPEQETEIERVIAGVLIYDAEIGPEQDAGGFVLLPDNRRGD